jgi:hypothetical protein
MWWEPTTEEDRALKLRMDEILSSFLGSEERIDAVHAVGTTSLGSANRRFPLVYLDASFLPNYYRRGWLYIDNWITLRRSILSRRSDVPAEVSRTEPRSRTLPRMFLFEADNDIQTLFERWNLPGETMIAFTDAPRPQFTASSLVWSPANHCTIGMVLSINGRQVATTAGHLVERAPCNILQKHSGFLGVTEERIGSVQYFNDPKGVAGVDVAVIELASGSHHPVSQMPPAAAAANQDQTTVTLRGAVSGVRQGWVNGDALLATRALGGRIWTNCWNVTELSEGFAQEGDSGGVVLTENNQVLGHLVGAVGKLRRRGRQCGLVQDITTTLSALRQHYGNAPIDVFVPNWPKKSLRNWIRQFQN